MKRYLFPLSCLFFLIFSVLFPQRAVTSATSGIRLWFQILLPSLFPSMVLSGILVSSGFLDSFFYFLKKLWHSLFALTPFGIYAFFFGILCGFPMGAKTTVDLYQSHKISKQEAYYLLTFSAFPSPSFLTAYLSLVILNHTVSNVLIFIILLLSNFFTSLFFRKIYSFSTSTSITFQKKKTSSPSFAKVLDVSIMNSLISITKLGGYILLFSVIQGFLQSLFPSQDLFSLILSGITEFSTGLACLKNATLPFFVTFPLAMSFTSFGGLCVLAQTSCVLSETDLSLSPYLAGRLVCCLITFGLSFLFVILI